MTLTQLKCFEKLKKKYYLFIILYGAIVLVVMNGFENIFGSRVDWLGQHTAFPDMFRNAFYQSKQLLPQFLFQIGGGQNAFMFSYYGFLSPLILPSYLLPFVDMTVYIIAVSIILYLAGGLLIFKFLKRHFDDNTAFAAALIYLSFPPILFHSHHHIMFVWYLPFLILALIGLDKYFESKKSLLFIISAFCIILTNYFFSVSCLVCLFVYAVYRILQEDKLTFKDFFKNFCGAVYLFIIPVLLSAFALLPTAHALLSNSRANEVSVNPLSLFFADISDNTYYAIGSVAVLFAALIANLTVKGIKKSEIFLNLTLSLFIILPIFSYALNGFLYARGKALIPFVVLIIYEFCIFLRNLREKKIRLLPAFIAILTLALILYAINKNNLSVLILTIIAVFAIIFLRQKTQFIAIFAIISLLCVSYHDSTNKEEPITIKAYNNIGFEQVEQLMSKTEDGIYRSTVSYDEKNMCNRTFGDNFYGTSLYSSTSNQTYQNFYETYMGNNEKYRNSFMTCGAENELFYTFMGTKYIVSDTDPGLYYEKIDTNGHLGLYENKLAYPLAYKSKKTLSEADFDKSPFPVSAELLMYYTVVEGGDPCIHFEPHHNKCAVKPSYTFTEAGSRNYQIELDKAYQNRIIYLSFDVINEGEYINKGDISITINGIANKLTARDWLYYNANTHFDYVIPLENSTTLDIKLTAGKYNIQNLEMYTSGVISDTPAPADNLQLDTFNSKLSCSLDAKEGEYLVTSIPYDKGFTAYINGEKAEITTVNKAFVGVKLKDGKNNIVVKYTAPLFYVGVLASIFGLALLMYELLKKKIWNFVKSHKEIVMYLIFGVLTTAVSLLTYYLCTALFLNAANPLQLQIANIISWIASVTFAYFTNKKYVFQSQNSILKEMAKFYASRLGTLGIDMALMYLFVSIMSINDLIAKTAVQFIVIISNYVISKFLVFKEEKKK